MSSIASLPTRLAAAVALAASAITAQAANVTLTGWAYGSAGTVNATTPVGGYAGVAGGYRGALAGAGAMDAASFVTYCIEIEEQFYFSALPMTGYALVDGDDYFQQRRGDAGIAEDIGRLLTYVADHPVANAAGSTALQLALWNLVYDGDATVSAGTFRDTSGFASAANAWLAGAAGTASRFDVWALTRSGSQDFIVAAARTPPSLTAQVPEPGTLGLAALALASVVLLGRRPRA